MASNSAIRASAQVAASSCRGLSTVSRAQVAVSGSRLDGQQVTDTGGSGADSTALSSSLSEASAKAVSIYREILRDIPEMRENFTIIEDEKFIRHVVRHMFDRHAGVRDSKIVDMLVFKARQEAGEIRNQWKSRYHVYQHINMYKEEMLRREAVQVAKSHATPSEQTDARRAALIQNWKGRGLIPAEIDSWEQYAHWKAEENEKFENFAVDNQIFTHEQLARNESAKSQCAIM